MDEDDMKDYDPTLARMAGNIAAGMATVSLLIKRPEDRARAEELLADVSTSIAKRILARCKEDYAALPAENLQ